MAKTPMTEAEKAKKAKEVAAEKVARDAKIKAMTPDQKKAFLAEEKAAKFVELGNARTAKALEAIEVIGNLATPNYVYTQEQADKIVAALTAEVATLSGRFSKTGATTSRASIL